MTIAIITFSATGHRLGQKICAGFLRNNIFAELTRCPEQGLRAWTAKHFYNKQALIFIGSCGIAVRAIAPFIKNKTRDPAVIVMDEQATFCISLLSGHLGGANQLAAELAAQTGATPVITTATDRQGLIAIDTWAKQQQLIIKNPDRIKTVASRILARQTVTLNSDLPITGPLPQSFKQTDGRADILITYRSAISPQSMDQTEPPLLLIPQILTLGIGCRRGTSCAAIEQALADLLDSSGCFEESLCAVASINLKASEPGILDFCKRKNLPFQTWSAAELEQVVGHTQTSTFVKQITGVDNVCERSALRSARAAATLVAAKKVWPGLTLALAARQQHVCFC